MFSTIRAGCYGNIHAQEITEIPGMYNNWQHDHVYIVVSPDNQYF